MILGAAIATVLNFSASEDYDDVYAVCLRIWQDGTAGATVCLHAWLYQHSGGTRAMLWCFLFGFFCITLPFLICNLVLIDSFEMERQVTKWLSFIGVAIHAVPIAVGLLAERITPENKAWLFLQARNCRTASVIGFYGVASSLVRNLQFDAATYTDKVYNSTLDQTTPAKSECGNDCYMKISIMHLATYLPFPIIIYYALLSDTNWWSNIEINVADLNPDVGAMMITSTDSCVPLDGEGVATAMDSMLTGSLTQVPRLDWNEVQTGRSIGFGATATVYKGEWRGDPVAVKKITCTDLTRDSLATMMQEVGITFALQTDTTVRFFGFYIALPEVCLVYEFCSRGTLTDVLRKAFKDGPPPGMPGPCHFALGACTSLAYLHNVHPTKKVIHRDIKPSNFLISEEWQIKLADFGEARFGEASGASMSIVGSPGYMAPEIISGKHGRAVYDHRVDIFSLGMVFSAIFDGKRPFEDEGYGIWDTQDAVASGKRPGIDPRVHSEYKRLIEQAWDGTPENRPTATVLQEALEALKQEWDPSYAEIVQGGSGDEPPQGEGLVPSPASIIAEANPVSSATGNAAAATVVNSVEHVSLVVADSVEKI